MALTDEDQPNHNIDSEVICRVGPWNPKAFSYCRTRTSQHEEEPLSRTSVFTAAEQRPNNPKRSKPDQNPNTEMLEYLLLEAWLHDDWTLILLLLYRRWRTRISQRTRLKLAAPMEQRLVRVKNLFPAEVRPNMPRSTSFLHLQPSIKTQFMSNFF